MLAFAATLTLAFAGETPLKGTYSKHYDFRDFTALAVSNSFQVDFTFSDDWTVDISVPDFIQPYLKVTCTGSKVRIGLEKLPKDIQRKLNNQSTPLQATVRMPKLLSLNMSGATRLTASGSQVLNGTVSRDNVRHGINETVYTVTLSFGSIVREEQVYRSVFPNLTYSGNPGTYYRIELLSDIQTKFDHPDFLAGWITD